MTSQYDRVLKLLGANKNIPTLDNELKKLESRFDKMIDQAGHNNFQEDRKSNLDFENIDKKLEQGKKNYKLQMKDLKEKFGKTIKRRVDPLSILDKTVYTVTDNTKTCYDHGYKIDKQLSNKLTSLFKQLKGKKIIRLEDQGQEIDIQAVINSRITFDDHVYRNSDKDKGLTFYIVLDQSGSMDSRIRHAVNIISTLYKSVEQVKEIKIKCLGFNGYRTHVNLTRVDKLKDVGKLNNSDYQTPTHYAIREAIEDMKKISGKKFLIVITDGQPNGDHPIGARVYEYNKYLINKCRRLKIGVMGIGISCYETAMEQIFDNDYINCDDMTDTKENLTKIFTQKVKMFLEDKT